MRRKLVLEYFKRDQWWVKLIVLVAQWIFIFACLESFAFLFNDMRLAGVVDFMLRT